MVNTDVVLAQIAYLSNNLAFAKKWLFAAAFLRIQARFYCIFYKTSSY